MRLRSRMIAAASMAALVVCSAGMVLGAPKILNEYNAVRSDMLLKNGAVDPYFGAIAGNGGDWMELVVTQDMLDIRGWSIVTAQNGLADATIVLPTLDAFASLRAGTILTIAENVATDLSYNPVYDAANPNAGDWWINFQSSFSAGDNTHSNFQVSILDATNALIFGPAGEGVSPASGVGNDEIFKLETAPSTSVAANSPYYKDGTSSTFGAPNLYSGGSMVQDFSQLRSSAAVPEPSSLLALAFGVVPMVMRKRRSIK